MADDPVDLEQTRRIDDLTRRLERLGAALAASPVVGASVRDLFAGPAPLVVPPDVADGNVIFAAHINAIKANIYQWQGNVDAANNDLYAVKLITGRPGNLSDTASAAVTAINLESFTGNQDWLQVRLVRKVAGSGWANASWVIERVIDGAYPAAGIQFGPGYVELFSAGELTAQFINTGFFLKKIGTTPGTAGSGLVYKDGSGNLKIS